MTIYYICMLLSIEVMKVNINTLFSYQFHRITRKLLNTAGSRHVGLNRWQNQEPRHGQLAHIGRESWKILFPDNDYQYSKIYVDTRPSPRDTDYQCGIYLPDQTSRRGNVQALPYS